MERVFAMPDLGEGLEEGRIVEWLVGEGDRVALNQPLVEVETAKAAVEIPSPFAGQIVTLHGSGDADQVAVHLDRDCRDHGSPSTSRRSVRVRLELALDRIPREMTDLILILFPPRWITMWLMRSVGQLLE